jgi:hypothetical protein
VETRARELALIAGREHSRVNASDHIQAKKELPGHEAAHDERLQAAKTRTKSEG